MILSGCGLGHTGLSAAEMVLGVCSSSGSLMQFWGDEILHATRLDKTRAFANLHGGRLALIFYSPGIVSLFADAWRLHSPLIATAGMAGLGVVTFLWNKELRGKTLRLEVQGNPVPASGQKN